MPIPRVVTDGKEGLRSRVGGTTGPYQRTAPSFPPTHSPPQWGSKALEDKEAEPSFLEFDLGPPLKLGLDIEHFFQELATKQKEDEGRDPSQEFPAEEHEMWVEWRGQTIDTPNL